MKTEISYFSISFIAVMLTASQAFAVTEAGQKQQRMEHRQSSLYMTNNMTDIGNMSGVEDAGEDEPINFSADEMENDDKNGLITARGNVEVEYNQMRLETDSLVYNQNTEIISAIGNVRLYTPDGAVVYGDKVSLSEKMSVGEMEHIKALLRDKSHVYAEKFRKKNNMTKVMNNAAYTACDICEGKSPLWTVTARKVQHNEKTHDMYYTDAVVHIKDVPIFYTPFLTHPDPTVKRRSGLMMPNMGSSNYLGSFIQPQYFWAVDDQTNVMFSPIISSKKKPAVGGLYEHYFYNAKTRIAGSFMEDNDADEDSRHKKRGYLFANGRYDINDLWRLNYDIQYVSDYIYLKDLNLPHQDDAWLTSHVQFERFSGRNYASIEALYYTMLSYNLRRSNAGQYRRINEQKPIVAPLIDVEIYSDPSKIGSYFKTELNTASVYHKNGSQTQRMTSINSWKLPMTTRFGEKYRFVASLKSDAYYVNDYRYAKNNTYTGTTTRFFPQAGVEWRLPFVRATEDSRQILEPVIVGVVAPDGGNKPDKIPNEDSADAYFDDTNVLDLDRYAGYDRNDTGSRVSYGLRWSTYGNIIGRTSSFIAQSFERKRDSSFANSLDSEDNTHFSDIVGRINAQPNEYLDLNYRFRLDKDSLDAKYSELSVGVGPSFLRADVSYIFLQGNTYYNDLYSERKELYMALSSEISQFWKMSVYNLRDLTKHSKGTLEHGGSVIYEDECFKWETTVRKYNSSNPDLKNSYEFGAMFYLKTLGGFGS